jgi:hypothetical protein
LVIAASLAIFGGLFAFVGIPSLGGGSKAGVAAAATPAQQIGMKVLLITDNTTEPSFTDWENTLQREGVPYDTVVTSTSDVLPALSTGQVANYEGVVLATSGTEGLTAAQWQTLQTFEHQFSVRQVTAYVVPRSDANDPGQTKDYGLNESNPVGGGALTSADTFSLTTDGKNVFPYLNTVALDPTQSTYAYEATVASPQAAGASVDTLISGPNNSSLLGIYTSADGRQTMYQTFDESQYYLQSELLRHGELDWLARNTYFGDQRNYLETDVDDNFLSDDSWSGRRAARGFLGRDDRCRVVRGSRLPHRHAVQRRGQRRLRGGLHRRGRRRRGIRRHWLDRGLRHRHRVRHRPTAGHLPGRQERLRLDQPHLGSPQHRRGLRHSGLHRG